MKSHIEIFTNSPWHWGKHLRLADLPPQHERSESPRDFSPFSPWDRTTSRRPACYACVARCPRSSVYPWWSWAPFLRDLDRRLGWWETTFHSAHSCHLSQHLRSQYDWPITTHSSWGIRKCKPLQLCKISHKMVQSSNYSASLQVVLCLNSQTSDWCQTVLRSRELHGRLPRSLPWILHDLSMFLHVSASWNHLFYFSVAICCMFWRHNKCSKFSLVSWSWKNPSRTKSRKRRTPWGDDSGSIWIWKAPFVVSHFTRHCRCHLPFLDSFISSRRTKPLSLRDIATMASCFTAALVPPHKRNKCNNAKMKTLWAMTTAEPEKHLSRLRLRRNKSSGNNWNLKSFDAFSHPQCLWLQTAVTFWFDILKHRFRAAYHWGCCQQGGRMITAWTSKIHVDRIEENSTQRYSTNQHQAISKAYPKGTPTPSCVEFRDIFTNVVHKVQFEFGFAQRRLVPGGLKWMIMSAVANGLISAEHINFQTLTSSSKDGPTVQRSQNHTKN